MHESGRVVVEVVKFGKSRSREWIAIPKGGMTKPRTGQWADRGFVVTIVAERAIRRVSRLLRLIHQVRESFQNDCLPVAVLHLPEMVG